MEFPIGEYGRLDAASKRAVEEWVSAHIGGLCKEVSDVGIAGDVAWFRRYLCNADGKRYRDFKTGNAASEIIRVPLKRPFPSGLQRVSVDID